MTTKKKYSLIIIGGGIVGLSSAIAWSTNRNSTQFPVLLLEKQPLVGGMLTSFRRKGYTFATAQLIPDPPKFSHGIWPSMQAGLQVVDMITGGEVLGGYSRLREQLYSLMH